MKQNKNSLVHPQITLVSENIGASEFKGVCVYHDVIFPFSVCEQKPGVEYRLRGQIKILDPHTGRTIKGSETAIRVRENNPRELKKIISKKVVKLSAKFDKQLNNIFRDHAISQEMYPLQMFRTFGREYLSRRGRSPDYRKDLSHRLEAVCEKFGRTPVAQISPPLIRQVYQYCGKTGHDSILLAYRFFAFCRDRKAYLGDNPLEHFIREELPRKKRGNAELLQRKAGEEKVFSKSEKEQSLRLIKDNLQDGRNMGILLIADGGLSAKEAVEFTWRNIIFSPDDYNYVILQLYKADNAGYTHCYDHPVFPYAGFLLHQRYEKLLEEYDAKAVQDFPVVSHAQNPKVPLTTSTMTAYCKQYLRIVFANGKNPMVPECAGVQFLLKDFSHRISYICGMEADPSAVRYMRGMSLTNDVTADNYRSFSGEDGQRYLYQYLCREQDFAHLFQDMSRDIGLPYAKEKVEGGTILRIFGEPGMINSPYLEFEIDDNSSGQITVSGKGGVELESARFRKLQD